MAELDVTPLFGPMLIGILLNTMLYGVMAVQAFMYYSRYKTDRAWFRYLVLYLVIVETVNWVCDVGLIYEPLIIRFEKFNYRPAGGTHSFPSSLASGYGHLTTLPYIYSPMDRWRYTDAALTVLISTPVQIFIAWRILVVTRSYILPGLIFCLAMVSLAGGVATTTVVSINPGFASFSRFRTEVSIWLIASTLCDVLLDA
ncbi:hypothetical protein MSAN_00110500 [Mycena sanguinolenta]|uniref:Uncharacterized protein n=1 Tax=Mycena sanguinolenta TaxID=230812 RepID=A0A8H6ZGE6_9AGAR|nr:hypothetical protein MSAN_00110500 [Mycena sanguinolenta]